MWHPPEGDDDVYRISPIWVMYTYMGHARGRIWDRGAPTTTTTTDDSQDDRRRPTTTTTTEPRVVGETSRDINTHDDDDRRCSPRTNSLKLCR